MPKPDIFLKGVFHEIGVANNGGMSLSSISFQELDAYCNRMKIDLTAWESMQIISMSRQYCSWLTKGKDPLCQSPWNDSSSETIAENNAKISEQFKSLRGKK